MYDDKTATPKIIFDAQRVPKDSYETIEERYKRAKESAERSKQKKQSSLNKLFPGELILTMKTWDGKLMSVPASMAESFQREQEKLKAKAEAGELPEKEPLNDELWDKFFSDTPLTDDEYDELFGKSSATKTDSQKQSRIETAAYEAPPPTNQIHTHNDSSSCEIYKQNERTSPKYVQNTMTKIINVVLIVALSLQFLFFTPYTLSKVEMSKQNVPHHVKMFTVFRNILFGESGYSDGKIRYVYELDYKRLILQSAIIFAFYFIAHFMAKKIKPTKNKLNSNTSFRSSRFFSHCKEVLLEIAYWIWNIIKRVALSFFGACLAIICFMFVAIFIIENISKVLPIIFIGIPIAAVIVYILYMIINKFR